MDPIEVKRVFVLANMFKEIAEKHPLDDTETAQGRIEELRAHVNEINTVGINCIVKDTDPTSTRLDFYSRAKWEDVAEKDILELFVYQGMGSMTWVTKEHTVALVQSELVRHCCDDSVIKIGKMKKFTQIYREILPIIFVVNYPDSGGRWITRIDDGSHRAVAMALDGIKTARILVGSLAPRA